LEIKENFLGFSFRLPVKSPDFLRIRGSIVPLRAAAVLAGVPGEIGLIPSI
jgi:hypothetical protein